MPCWVRSALILHTPWGPACSRCSVRVLDVFQPNTGEVPPNKAVLTLSLQPLSFALLPACPPGALVATIPRQASSWFGWNAFLTRRETLAPPSRRSASPLPTDDSTALLCLCCHRGSRSLAPRESPDCSLGVGCLCPDPALVSLLSAPLVPCAPCPCVLGLPLEMRPRVL